MNIFKHIIVSFLVVGFVDSAEISDFGSVEMMKEEAFAGELASLEMMPLEVLSYLSESSKGIRISHISHWGNYSYCILLRKKNQIEMASGIRKKPMIIGDGDLVIDIDRFSTDADWFNTFSEKISGSVLDFKEGMVHPNVDTPYFIIEKFHGGKYSYWIVQSKADKVRFSNIEKQIDDIENLMSELKLE